TPPPRPRSTTPSTSRRPPTKPDFDSLYSRMKHVWAVMVALAVAMPESASQRRVLTIPPDDSLTIAFVESDANDASIVPAGSDAWLDLKRMSQTGGPKEKAIRTRHRFGVKVVSAGRATGAAVISASLSSWDGRATYRL